MKPVAIFRHAPTEGPGYFATYLMEHNIPWQLIRIDANDPIPIDPTTFSGLAFMGGPMSVNDKLQWIPKITGLISLSVAKNIPLIGHCLGGQLISKSLGGTVSANSVREIGWGKVEICQNPAAAEWFGDMPQSFYSFHWHGETFTIPQRATRILASDYCDNQAFVLDKHLAMQCHVEMTEEMIKLWCETGKTEVATHLGPSVQSVDEIQNQISKHLTGLNRVARKLYDRWTEGLAR